MSAQQLRKALFIFTECDTIPRSNGKATGFYLPEAAHPYYELTKAGANPLLT